MLYFDKDDEDENMIKMLTTLARAGNACFDMVKIQFEMLC